MGDYYHYDGIAIEMVANKVGSNWPIVDQHGKKKITQALILGLGSMFNHSTNVQNVGFERDLARQVVTYRALRDIPAGQELCMHASDVSVGLS